MKKLTEKQQRTLDCIVKYSAEYGYPPTVRELAKLLGVSSTSTVHSHLRALEERGLIMRSQGSSRAIITALSQEGSMPVCGTVAAGGPIPAFEDIVGYVPYVPNGSREEHFALRIRGDSMLNAGIMDGDTVVVHRQATAENGEIVIALLGDEATCKRLSLEGGKVLLMPENEAYEPIDGSGALILGRVTAVIREYT